MLIKVLMISKLKSKVTKTQQGPPVRSANILSRLSLQVKLEKDKGRKSELKFDPPAPSRSETPISESLNLPSPPSHQKESTADGYLRAIGSSKKHEKARVREEVIVPIHG